MKDLFRTILGKIVNGLISMKQKQMDFPISGKISVGDKQVTCLTPLGGYHRAGISKVGRLSFRGLCDGRKVKIYSFFSKRQMALRVAVQNLCFNDFGFPEIISVDDNLIIEEWVYGTPVHTLNSSARFHVAGVVAAFLQANREQPAVIDLVETHRGAFCYLQDYLLLRLGVWLYLDEVRQFALSWLKDYDDLRSELPEYLSHPDLSQTNLIIEKNSGRVISVDNELLGVGPGWILDWYNSCLGKWNITACGLENIPASFLENTWRLRLLGSALDAGDFTRAYAILSK